MAPCKEAAKIFEGFSDENKAAANAAFQAASDALKNVFNFPVAYDDRAERLVHQIALYMSECSPTVLDPTPTNP